VENRVETAGARGYLLSFRRLLRGDSSPNPPGPLTGHPRTRGADTAPGRTVSSGQVVAGRSGDGQPVDRHFERPADAFADLGDTTRTAGPGASWLSTARRSPWLRPWGGRVGWAYRGPGRRPVGSRWACQRARASTWT